MTVLEKISKEDLKEILNKGWMTHDAMWFLSSYQTFGIEAANNLNRSAIGLMSALEAKRVKKALGMEGVEIDSTEKLQRFLQGAFDLVIPKFMKTTFSFPNENTIRWEWEKDKCFAYVGIKKIGAIDKYQCGVIYRVECWLDALNISYSMQPKVTGCLMHSTGSCAGDIIFSFDSQRDYAVQTYK